MERCPHCGGDLGPFPAPLITVDAIVEIESGMVLLVRRRFDPLGWALPGGFVEVGESLEAACQREVLEETALTVDDLTQFHAYSNPDRDTRRHTITVVFVCRPHGIPKAGDDAGEIGVFPLEALPEQICFDHRRILHDYQTSHWGAPPRSM